MVRNRKTQAEMIPSFSDLRKNSGSIEGPTGARSIVRIRWTLVLLVLLSAGFTSKSQAEEQWQPFLESLRTAGYHDMAIFYLDRMAARPDCPPQLLEVLDYERGITLLSQPVSTREEQLEKLTKTTELFERFRKDHPDHPNATKAQTQLANVLIERGRLLVTDADAPGVTPEQRDKGIAEARQFYDDAKKVFQEQDVRLTEELKNWPEPKTAMEIEQRDALRADFLQTRLSLATADYEIGMTYPATAPERKTLLESAAKQYKDLYDKYGSFLAGLYARMWEGRCYQKLENFNLATDAFESIMMQADDSQAFRTLKNKSTALLIETLIDPKVKRYQDAINFYADWEKGRPPSDASTPEGLEIRYLSALASLELARSLEADNKDRKKLLIDARGSLRFVMRFPGETRTRARQTMADPLLAVDEGQRQEPQDFAEALELGRAALDKIEIAQIRQQMGQEALSQEELQKITDEAEQEAFGYFEQAIQLAQPETPVEEVNQARYYLAYLSFKQGDLYRAVVFSDFLARRFPNSAVGRPASKIAMAAFAAMMSQPGITPEQKDFAERRMSQAAAYIVAVWPNSSEATEARKILVHSALRQEDIPQAIAMVEQIPPDAPGRGPLQLLVGRALYAEYVRQMTKQSAESPDETNKNEPEAETPSQASPLNAEELLDQAKSLLVSGLKLSIEEGKIDRSFLAGELTLARIYLNEGSDAAAFNLVEHPDTGLLALAQSSDSTIVEGDLDIEAYKTSLRALVAVRELEKASRVMELLENRVAQTAGTSGGTQLMQIYVSLAQELQQTLEMLQKSGKTEEANQVRAGFEQFLDRVSSSSESTSFNVMQWIAATYNGLGHSFDTKGGSVLSPEAKGYYEKSAAVYEKIIKQYGDDESFAPSVEAIDTIEIHLAICLRELGRYNEALKHLFNVLQYRNTMVDAQMEAASTYQAWAGNEGKAHLYLNAMLGGASRTRKSDGAKANVFWGWGALSKRLARDKQHRDLFHDARYNLALCRYKYAISDACKERQKNLEAAQLDIKVVARLYPEMGGAEMKAKYEALSKKIEQALKK